MKITATQRELIVHCLRVAAERFRHDAKTAQKSDLTFAAAQGFSDTFEKQSSDADQLADIMEDGRLCHYTDCSEGNPTNNVDEQVTCHRCRGRADLPTLPHSDE